MITNKMVIFRLTEKKIVLCNKAENLDSAFSFIHFGCFANKWENLKTFLFKWLKLIALMKSRWSTIINTKRFSYNIHPTAYFPLEWQQKIHSPTTFNPNASSTAEFSFSTSFTLGAIQFMLIFRHSNFFIFFCHSRWR